jgi:hypothetical protein
MSKRFLFPVMAIVAALAMVALSNSVASADRRDFVLVNNSSVTFIEAYVSPSESDDWGEDVMPYDVLYPGESIDIVFDRFVAGTCLYDIKVIGADGSEGVLWKVNLCTITTVTFS